MYAKEWINFNAGRFRFSQKLFTQRKLKNKNVEVVHKN